MYEGPPLECRMRIAFYAPLKSPTHDVPSGDRRVARLLMQALQMAGHDVELVSDFRSFEAMGDPERQTGLRDAGQRIARDLVECWQGIGAQKRPDLWFTYHLYYKAPDWLGPMVCQAMGLPYVVAEASHAPKRAGGPWAIGHEAALAAIRMADLLLCPTRDDVAALEKVSHAGSVVLRLAPFLDPAPYGNAAQQRDLHRAQLAAAHALDTLQPWMIVVAMMRSGDKLASYGLLAQTLRTLADLPWQMLVAGDGPARAQVREMLEQAAPGRARLMGQLDADAMAAAYAASDLCIWPAVNEAYGMSMLEAQAAGVPVVACAVRGVPDVVCDGLTGLLAPAGDTRQLAALARSLIVDAPRRRAMGQAARRFVQDERSLGQAVRQLNDAFDRLRSAAGPGSRSADTT